MVYKDLFTDLTVITKFKSSVLIPPLPLSWALWAARGLPLGSQKTKKSMKQSSVTMRRHTFTNRNSWEILPAYRNIEMWIKKRKAIGQHYSWFWLIWVKVIIVLDSCSKSMGIFMWILIGILIKLYEVLINQNLFSSYSVLIVRSPFLQKQSC